MNINQWRPVIKIPELLDPHLTIRQIRYQRKPPSGVLLIKTNLTMKFIGAKNDAK